MSKKSNKQKRIKQLRPTFTVMIGNDSEKQAEKEKINEAIVKFILAGGRIEKVKEKK